MPDHSPSQLPRHTWATKAINWLYFQPLWMQVVLCLIAGIAIIGTSAILTWTIAIPNPIAQFILIAIFLGVTLLLFVCAAFRFLGEQIIQHISGPDALRRMNASALEALTLALFESQGYKTRLIAIPGKPDGGVDLKLFRDGEYGLVQCKKWTYENVGVDKIRELYGVMKHQDADFGIFITTSNFTEEAEKFAHDKPIELLNHAALWDLVQVHRLQDVLDKAIASPKLEIVDNQPLQCPRCNDVLVLRHSHRGPFLGCNSYHSTGCRTIVKLGQKNQS